MLLRPTTAALCGAAAAGAGAGAAATTTTTTTTAKPTATAAISSAATVSGDIIRRQLAPLSHFPALYQAAAAAAVAAQRRAYAPYSHFGVGACLLHADGALTVGCNYENCTLQSCCAERCAIVTANCEGRRTAVAVAVYGTALTALSSAEGEEELLKQQQQRRQHQRQESEESLHDTQQQEQQQQQPQYANEEKGDLDMKPNDPSNQSHSECKTDHKESDTTPHTPGDVCPPSSSLSPPPAAASVSSPSRNAADDYLCPPCGLCRQLLVEVADLGGNYETFDVILVTRDTTRLKVIPLRDLIPCKFGPADIA